MITACDYDDWYVDVNVPTMATTPLRRTRTCTATTTTVPCPPSLSATSLVSAPSARAASTTSPSTSGSVTALTHELMIWTENWGQRPAGNQVGTVTFGGHDYQVWRSGSGDGGIITYVSTPSS